MSDQQQHQNFDELFKEGLFDHEVTPPQHVWENMQGELHSPRAKTKELFVKSASLIVALLLSVSLGYYAHTGKTAASPEAANNLSNESHPTASGSFFSPSHIDEKNDRLLPFRTFGNRIQNQYGSLFSPTSPNLLKIKRASFAAPTAAILTGSVQTGGTRTFATSGKTNELGANQALISGSHTLAASQTAFPYKKEALGHTANTNLTNVGLILNDQSAALPDVENPTQLPLLAAADIANTHKAGDIEARPFERATKERVRKTAAKLPNKSIAKTTGFYFGGIGSINSSWIFNREAIKENPQGKLTYRPDFGTAYGFAMGYDFNEAWGLEMNWIVNSHQGQKFLQFRPESKRNNQTDINLTYTYFPVLLKYKMQKTIGGKKLRPFVVNYLFGIQYGKLRAAEINLYNAGIQSDLLQKTNWGLVMGIDTHWYLTDHYFLSLGLRSSISASSQNSNSIVMPGPGKTNNLLVGLQAGLHYRFAR